MLLQAPYCCKERLLQPAGGSPSARDHRVKDSPPHRHFQREAIAYIITQLIAAIVAALVVGFLVGWGKPLKITGVAQAFLAEFLFTFALAYVVLNTATAKAYANNSFFGLAIGMTVMTGAFAVGPISGGAFNPAVALGIGIMQLLQFSNIWIHFLADFAGGAAAGVVFKFTNPTDP